MIFNKEKKDTKALTKMGVNSVKLFFLLFIFLFSISLVSSAQFGYNYLETTPITSGTTNVSMESVNSSDYWDNLDTPLDAWISTYNSTYDLWAYNQTVAGGGSSVSFGTDNQIPYTNAGGDDFDYSSVLTFDGTNLKLISDSAHFYLGAGEDAGLIYDGSDLYITSDYVGSGQVRIKTNNGNFQIGNSYSGTGNTFARFFMPHYNKAEEPLYVFAGSSQASENYIGFGGGSALGNAATQITFSTATNTITPTGTYRFRIRKDDYIEFANTDEVRIIEDNTEFCIGASGCSDSYIKFDATNQNFYSASGVHYFQGDVSANDLIDRSVYWNESLGSALESSYDTKLIETDDDLPDFEKVTYEVTDFDRPYNWTRVEEECGGEGNCYNVTKSDIIYPYKKNETGRLISAVVARNTQALHEINLSIDIKQYEGLETPTLEGHSAVFDEIYTKSKVIELGKNYAIEFLDINSLASKKFNKNKVNVQDTDTGEQKTFLNAEDRIVDLEGAFANHMTCLANHKKYDDYRACMGIIG